MSTKFAYRPNVCLIIINRSGELFLGERLGEPGIWQFPQGGVEAGDSPEASALREASEELGAPQGKFQVIKQLSGSHRYDFKTPREYSQVKWRGQSQTFWLLSFLGSDAEITLAGPDKEFSSFRWCSIAQVRELAEPKRLKGYEVVLAEVEKFLHKN